ncbi:MAG: hypothetical protein GQ582_12775 [Methyloprofundus sp.]|nr:hypothetical protein [Methyloprofundus sp.]
MKTLQQTIRCLMTLAVMLLAYNAPVLALSVIDIPATSIQKIPAAATMPSIPEIQLPSIIDIDPLILACTGSFPDPELFLTGKSESLIEGTAYITYSLTVNNRGDYPDYLFEASPNLPPCGLNNEASRTWALLYNQSDEYLYGFCALSGADQLAGLWFSHKKSDPAPEQVYLVLQDRLCNKEYQSAAISLGETEVAADAPLIAGIGLVPKSLILQTNGLATTGPDDAFKDLKDAPFGNSLRFMGNIQQLHNLGVTQYIVAYCDMGQYNCTASSDAGFVLDEWKTIEDVRTNYYWNATKGQYILHRDSPIEVYNDGHYIFKAYPVPASNLTWYFNNLLFDWATQGAVKVQSGLYRVHLFALTGADVSSIISLPAEDSTLVVQIDNTPPIMAINSISYNGVAVNSCSIVTLGNMTDAIDFNITATDAEGYLDQYSFTGEYGDNQNLNCTSESYTTYLANGGSSPKWFGTSASSDVSCGSYTVSCGYSYHLSGWDRAINGYTRIHYVDTFKTLTIQMP